MKPNKNPGPIPNPTPIPSSWPKTGTLDGKEIDLEEAQRTLSPLALGTVIVIIDGQKRQPWKGSDYFIDTNGKFRL